MGKVNEHKLYDEKLKYNSLYVLANEVKEKLELLNDENGSFHNMDEIHKNFIQILNIVVHPSKYPQNMN